MTKMECSGGGGAVEARMVALIEFRRRFDAFRKSTLEAQSSDQTWLREQVSLFFFSF